MNNVDVATCRLVDDYLTTVCQIKVGPHCSCIVVISIIERTHLDTCIRLMYAYITLEKFIHCL
jgi:hypothetical protein